MFEEQNVNVSLGGKIWGGRDKLGFNSKGHRGQKRVWIRITEISEDQALI